MNQQNKQPENQIEKHRFDPELLKQGLRCDLDQYEMLKRCSDKKDITEWNEWRKKFPHKEIFLEGAILEGAYLKGVNLKNAYLENANLKNAIFCPKYDENNWHQGEADFRDENEGKFAILDEAILNKTKLQYSILNGASLKGVHITEACLKGTRLMFADLEKAFLLRVNMQDSVLEDANIKDIQIYVCDLRRANFRMAKVDSSTSFWEPEISKYPKGYIPRPSEKDGGRKKYTDFLGVPLDSIRINPNAKQLLEYNIRRYSWGKWYPEQHWLLAWFVCNFWGISDYGISTKRIIFTFFGLAFLFALLYRLFPGFVMVYGKVGDIRGFWHALYFSVVTMTTLGFGDIAANPDSWVGQTLLMIQVILGYVLLGALVTRFAVLFTAGGPAGKFADEKEKEDKKKHKNNC